MRLLTTRDSPRHRSSVWGTPVFVAGFPVNNVWNIFYAPFSMHKNDRASGLERTLRIRSEIFDRDLPHRGAAGQFCANGMSENGSKHFGHCGRIVREYEGGNQPRVTVVRALGERPRSEGSSMVRRVDRGRLHTCLRPGPSTEPLPSGYETTSLTTLSAEMTPRQPARYHRLMRTLPLYHVLGSLGPYRRSSEARTAGVALGPYPGVG
jgi:hypothetical protein